MTATRRAQAPVGGERSLSLSSAPAQRRLSDDHLWTQSEASYFLAVSQRYLRESSCPKVLLPGNGKKRQPLVRYRPADVIAWANNWRCGSSAERSA